LKRALTRAFVRARLPVAYSEGFNPRPKISMGPALPLGYESRCELTDIVLSEGISDQALREMLGPNMPEGLDLLEVEQMSPGSLKLSQASSACYMVELPETETIDSADSLTREFLMKESLLVERTRKDTTKVVDIRPFVIGAAVTEKADSRWLQVETLIGGQGSCSASEVAQAVFNLPLGKAKCLRTIRTEIRFYGRPPWVNADEENKEEADQEGQHRFPTA
jgi:radical SAM-linked protein